MLKMIIEIILLTLTFRHAESSLDHLTALAIKQGVTDYQNNSIALGVETFKDLVKKSEMFVDTTLFIKEHMNYFKGVDSVLMICPSKWGRTINLDMMKTFLQIQVDDQGNEILPKEETSNYKLFAKGEITLDDGRLEKLQKPLLIANEEKFMSEYQGRYPVIYVTLKDAIGENLTVIEHKMRIAVSRAFKEHEYMIKVLEKKHDANSTADLEDFKHYLHHKDWMSLNCSLRFLSKVLAQHFNKKPFIIMDDYEKPLYSFLQPDHYVCPQVEALIKQVIIMVEWLTLGTYRNNTNLHHGLISGTIKLYRKIEYGWWGHVIYYIIDEQKPTREFFGFHKKEVQLLFRMDNISENLASLAHKWYNGKVSNYSGDDFYESTSIIQFLNTKEIKLYRKEDHFNENLIHKSLKAKTSSFLRHGMLKLISKDKVCSETEFFLNIEEIYHMRKLSTDEWEKYWGENFFYAYLSGEGYIATDDEQQRAILINSEMAFLLSTWMISYYKAEFHIKEIQLQHAAITMYDFIQSEQNEGTMLEKSLTALYKDCAPYMDYRDLTYDPIGPFPAVTVGNIELMYSRTDYKEDPPLGILNCVLLRVQGLAKFEIDVYYHNIQKADILTIDSQKSLGVVIQLSRNSSNAESALKMAKKHKPVFKNFTNIKKKKLVGINIEFDKTIHILAESIN